MRCIFCNNADTKVIDSRSTDDLKSIRRRRECEKCGKRFTTYEIVESVSLLVIKNDGSREPFDKLKIKNGIIKATDKRKITNAQIDEVVNDIEREIQNMLIPEVSSRVIGELVMKKLKVLDEVSFIRFASVYRQFEDVTNFKNFINNI